MRHEWVAIIIINQIPATMLGTIWSSLTALTVGNLAVFRFYLKWLFIPYQRLPPELYNEAILSRRMAKGESFDLVIDRSFVDGYNRGIDDMKEHIKRLWGASPQVGYRTKQILFWIVRLATVAAAFSSTDDQSDKDMLVFYISLLQFLVVPYSLSVALGYGLETVFVLYTGHICVFPILTVLSNKLLPPKYDLAVTISPTFLVAFLIIDQIICVITLFYTPAGKSEKMPARRIWQSVWYGFLNCKTYYLVLLPLCYGTKITIIPWLVDYFFGLSNLIT